MKNLKKLSRIQLKNLHGGKTASVSTGIGNGAEEAQAYYCSTEQGSTFLGYMTYEGCYYACTKNLDNQPK